MYSIIFCGILLRTSEASPQQRKSAINSAIGNSLTVLPILVYQVLLADKLDGDLKWPFIAVSAPLLIALITLVLLSFSAKGGNKCKYSNNLLSQGSTREFIYFACRVVRDTKEFQPIPFVCAAISSGIRQHMLSHGKCTKCAA